MVTSLESSFDMVLGYGKSSTTLYEEAMTLLNFLRQKSSTVHTTIGGSSSVIPSENKDAVNSAVNMGRIE